MIGPSSTEHVQDSCSFQLCCTVIYQTVPSPTRADTVVANAPTKKVSEQDTKHYVGRNGKSAKTTHTSVWIAQDTTESRLSSLNVCAKI